MAKRGRPSRSEDVAGYLAWRSAEEEAADAYGDPAPAAKVAHAMFAGDETGTVWDWRKVTPSVDVWRAWLVDRFGDKPGMADYIASGALDEARHSRAGESRQAAIARYHRTVIPGLATDLRAIRGVRVADDELSAMTGASLSTVRRYRTD